MSVLFLIIHCVEDESGARLSASVRPHVSSHVCGDAFRVTLAEVSPLWCRAAETAPDQRSNKDGGHSEEPFVRPSVLLIRDGLVFVLSAPSCMINEQIPPQAFYFPSDHTATEEKMEFDPNDIIRLMDEMR